MRHTARVLPWSICMLVVASLPARADNCSAETAQLSTIAKTVEVKIEEPKGNVADAPAHISWHATVRVPIKVPAFIAIAIPGEVRFRVPPLAPKPRTADADPDVAVKPPELPGFLALTPQTRGPLGLEFGKGMT